MPTNLYAVKLLAIALDVGRLGWRRASALRCPTSGSFTAWWGSELSGVVFRLLLGLHMGQVGLAFATHNAAVPARLGGSGMAGGVQRALLLLFYSGSAPLLFLWGKPVRLR